MKSAFALALIVLSSPFAHADTRVTGAAAAELYAKLNIAEVAVADEHNGPVYAYAKYGQNVGCQRDLTSTQFECWFTTAR